MFEVGGAICKDRLCGWESARLEMCRCPLCGEWCRYWHAEVEDDDQARSVRRWFDGCWFGAQTLRARRSHSEPFFKGDSPLPWPYG